MFEKLLKPRFPSCAVGIDSGAASVVQLDRARGGFVVKRAALIDLPADLIRAGFDESNIGDPTELASALRDLVTSAGLLRQRKWSVSLPEATARAAILTIEGTPGSRRELEEVLEWKIERSFGAPRSELRLAREALPLDARKQKRYLITAGHLAIVAEYESLFAAMGWQAGLILPRHVGEEQWLRNGHHGDSLLLTSHDEGFTAVLMRDNRPFVMRTVFCESADCDDEIHRIMLFYRDRAGTNGSDSAPPIDRLLVIGNQLDRQRVSQIAQETLGTSLKPLDPPDVGLMIPGREISFDLIAAPAGLAKMAW